MHRATTSPTFLSMRWIQLSKTCSARALPGCSALDNHEEPSRTLSSPSSSSLLSSFFLITDIVVAEVFHFLCLILVVVGLGRNPRLWPMKIAPTDCVEVRRRSSCVRSNSRVSCIKPPAWSSIGVSASGITSWVLDTDGKRDVKLTISQMMMTDKNIDATEF
ncbi:unnamed protein product [Soboliphyme baturini]|uniref:Secreted protein n=1 Tax=Soboliphyme baturini TaxID=241478 RepID=A0A183JBB4_9BILA|nr:unnamed protein product [Soboliphyme baturini]